MYTSFKTQTATFFNDRGSTYDSSPFHAKVAKRLVDISSLKPGEIVLDIATGTGLAAIEAAQCVSPTGRVLGIDIVSEMLKQAELKAEKLELKNIEFQLADAENLSFPKASFDVILCVSSLPYMTEIPTAIRAWYELLKPEGRFVFQGYSETSFINGVVLRKVASQFNIDIIFNQKTGTKERCQQLLNDAGFNDIAIEVEQIGSFITFESVKESWSSMLKVPMAAPLLELSEKQLKLAEKQYYDKLEKLVTEKGIWNEISCYYCMGKKAPALDLHLKNEFCNSHQGFNF